MWDSLKPQVKCVSEEGRTALEAEERGAADQTLAISHRPLLWSGRSYQISAVRSDLSAIFYLVNVMVSIGRLRATTQSKLRPKP